MRFLIACMAGSALVAGITFADDHGHDHDHDKSKKTTETVKDQGAHGSSSSYGSHSSYGSGTDGHTNMDHSNMDHSKMDHANMGHDNMGHGMDHMKGSKTMPADGAVLDHSPKMLGVNFGHTMKVESITVSTLTGEMIELDVSEVGETSHIMVASPELQSDDYVVDWRALGHDGHVMSGSFAFTVE